MENGFSEDELCAQYVSPTLSDIKAYEFMVEPNRCVYIIKRDNCTLQFTHMKDAIRTLKDMTRKTDYKFRTGFVDFMPL